MVLGKTVIHFARSIRSEKTMNILVTGGCGYIGSVLVSKLLRAGHSVQVLDNLSQCVGSLKHLCANPRFSFVLGNVHNDLGDALDDVHAIVHLAALRQKDCEKLPPAAWQTNYTATFNLANLCNDVKLIFASSCSVYGVTDNVVDEYAIPFPLSVYAETKLAAEEPVLAAGGIVLRFATAYGGSLCMRKDLIVHQLLADAMKGKIEVYDPDAHRSLIHVKDIARGISLALDKNVRGEIFNLGEGNYRKRDLVEFIRARFPSIVVEEVQRGDVRDYRASFEKARQILDFVPEHNVAGWIVGLDGK